jgi:hypothetical protein
MAWRSMESMNNVSAVQVTYPQWYRHRVQTKSNNGKDPLKWTLTHSYYANMGGFQLREEMGLFP